MCVQGRSLLTWPRDPSVKDHLEIGSSCWRFVAPMKPMKPIEPKDEVCSDRVSTGSQYSMPEYSADDKKRLTFKKRQKERRPLDQLGKTFSFSLPSFAFCYGDHVLRRHLSPPPWPTRMRFV